MFIPKGITIKKNNKTYRGEIPDSLLTKKQLDSFGKKPNKSNKKIEKKEIEKKEDE